MQIAPAAEAIGTSSRLADGPDREEEEIDVARTECLGGRFLDDELAVAERHARAGRARGRERADVLVTALGEQRERHGADRAGRSDDADSRACAHVLLF